MGQTDCTESVANTNYVAPFSSPPSLGVLTAALDYASAGIPVFPCRLRAEGDKKAKSPYTQHGFLDASCQTEQIKRWWANYPDAIIGMPTGKVSGLVVMDIDPVWYKNI